MKKQKQPISGSGRPSSRSNKKADAKKKKGIKNLDKLPENRNRFNQKVSRCNQLNTIEIKFEKGSLLLVDQEFIQALRSIIYTWSQTGDNGVLFNKALPGVVVVAAKRVYNFIQNHPNKELRELPQEVSALVNSFCTISLGIIEKKTKDWDGTNSRATSSRCKSAGVCCPLTRSYAGLSAVLLQMCRVADNTGETKRMEVGQLIASSLIKQMVARVDGQIDAAQWLNAKVESSRNPALEHRLVHVGRFIACIVKLFAVKLDFLGQLVTRVVGDDEAWPLLFGLLNEDLLDCLGHTSKNKAFEDLPLWVRGFLLALIWGKQWSNSEWVARTLQALNGLDHFRHLVPDGTKIVDLDVWFRQQFLPEILTGKDSNGKYVLAMICRVLGTEWINRVGLHTIQDVIINKAGSVKGRDSVIEGIGLAISWIKRKGNYTRGSMIHYNAIQEDLEDIDWCRGLLEELVSSKEGQRCKEPLYVKLLPTVVKRSLKCFRDVHTKLAASEYENVAEFLKDVLAVIDDWENHLAEDSNFQTMAKRLRASFLSKVRARGLRILSSLDNHIVPIQCKTNAKPL